MVMITKKDIITAILALDARQGRFYPNGQYRYGIEFYYGKLDKYPKVKLLAILEKMDAKTGSEFRRMRLRK